MSKTIQTVIDLGYHKTSENCSGTRPYTIAFVYTPNKQAIIKGMLPDVRNHISQHFPISVYNLTFWRNGKDRSYWSSTSNLKILFTRKRDVVTRRHVTEIKIYNRKDLLAKTVRRVPWRWIPFYDLANSKF